MTLCHHPPRVTSTLPRSLSGLKKPGPSERLLPGDNDQFVARTVTRVTRCVWERGDGCLGDLWAIKADLSLKNVLCDQTKSVKQFSNSSIKFSFQVLWFVFAAFFLFIEIHWIPPVIKSNQTIEKTNRHYLGSGHLTESVRASVCQLWGIQESSHGPGPPKCPVFSSNHPVNQDQLRRQHSHYYLITKQCHSIVNCRLPLSPRLLSWLQTGPVSVKW